MKKFKWVDDFFKGPLPPSMDKIAQRLKDFSDTMEPVYTEIEGQVDDDGRYYVLLAAIQSAYVSEKKTDLRDGPGGLKDLQENQKRIMSAADKLINLLNDREQTLAKKVLKSTASLDPMKLIFNAFYKMKSTERRNFFRENLAPVFGDWNTRLINTEGYALTLQEMLQALKDEMENTQITFKTSMIKTAFKSRKATLTADFTRCFLTEINRLKWLGLLPENFLFSSTSLAILIESIFNLYGGVTRASVEKVIERY